MRTRNGAMLFVFVTMLIGMIVAVIYHFGYAIRVDPEGYDYLRCLFARMGLYAVAGYFPAMLIVAASSDGFEDPMDDRAH
jgi:hypothetical protein